MSTMRAVRLLTVSLTAIGFGFIAVSIATGELGSEGSTLLDLPWGRMSLVDIYIGVALIAGWVFLREEKTIVAVLWLPAFVVLGHAGTALYAALASFRSDTVGELLLGARMGDAG